MTIEQNVIKHYGREGLAEAILDRAREKADNPDALTTEDLAFYDDMHVGGRQATAHFLARLGLVAGSLVLDIGAGIGGAARYAAENYVIKVTGIDLTPEYKAVAEALSAAVGLAERTEFVTGSALDLPFEAGTFDAAFTIHAAMNIQNKAQMYAEAQRVLKPGGVFGIYDIMAGRQAESLTFPVPWADDQNTSFLLSPREIEGLLEAAGFEVTETESRQEFGLAALHRLLEIEAAGAQERPEPIRRPGFPNKVRNLVENIESGYCAPWEIICRKL